MLMDGRENQNMEKYNIRFQSMDQIVNFVKWGEHIDKHMDLSAGVLDVDAKSMMGIVYMGLNKDLVLTVQGQLAENEKAVLRDYLS
jgi:phosphotransferase system HPr-like phosphotransfer protein